MSKLFITEKVLTYFRKPIKEYSLKGAKKIFDISRAGHVVPLKELRSADLPHIPRIFSDPAYEIGLCYIKCVSQWFAIKGSRDSVDSPISNAEVDRIYLNFIHNHPGNRFFDYLPSPNDLDTLSKGSSEIITSKKGLARYYIAQTKTRHKGFLVISPFLTKWYFANYQNWRKNYLNFRIPHELLEERLKICVFGFQDRHNRIVDFLPWSKYEAAVKGIPIWDHFRKRILPI